MIKLFNLKYFKNFVFILFILFVVVVGGFINPSNIKYENSHQNHLPKPNSNSGNLNPVEKKGDISDVPEIIKLPTPQNINNDTLSKDKNDIVKSSYNPKKNTGQAKFNARYSNLVNQKLIPSKSHINNSISLIKAKQMFLQSAPKLLRGIRHATMINMKAEANFTKFVRYYTLFIRHNFKKLFKAKKISRQQFNRFIKSKIQFMNRFLKREQTIFSQNFNTKFNQRKNFIFNSAALKIALRNNYIRSKKISKTKQVQLTRTSNTNSAR